MQEPIGRSRLLENDDSIIGTVDAGGADLLERILRAALNVGRRCEHASARAVQYEQVVVISGNAEWIRPEQVNWNSRTGTGSRGDRVELAYCRGRVEVVHMTARGEATRRAS